MSISPPSVYPLRLKHVYTLPSFLLLIAAACLAQQVDGQKLYMSTCNNCHKADAGVGAPGYLVLAQMPPRAILSALETGKMRVQAKDLSEDQRKAVVRW